MSGSVSNAAKAEPNLTPILDMVFQLITFFMLVINFKSAELDLSLKLPVVGSARPRETAPGQSLLVLNLKRDEKNPAGYLSVYGQIKPDIEKYLKLESTEELKKRKWTVEDIRGENAKELPVMVVIRADRTAPFSLLNRVIKSCQDNGFRDFALKALNREGK